MVLRWLKRAVALGVAQSVDARRHDDDELLAVVRQHAADGVPGRVVVEPFVDDLRSCRRCRRRRCPAPVDALLELGEVADVLDAVAVGVGDPAVLGRCSRPTSPGGRSLRRSARPSSSCARPSSSPGGRGCRAAGCCAACRRRRRCRPGVTSSATGSAIRPSGAQSFSSTPARASRPAPPCARRSRAWPLRPCRGSRAAAATGPARPGPSGAARPTWRRRRRQTSANRGR